MTYSKCLPLGVPNSWEWDACQNRGSWYRKSRRKASKFQKLHTCWHNLTTKTILLRCITTGTQGRGIALLVADPWRQQDTIQEVSTYRDLVRVIVPLYRKYFRCYCTLTLMVESATSSAPPCLSEFCFHPRGTELRFTFGKRRMSHLCRRGSMLEKDARGTAGT